MWGSRRAGTNAIREIEDHAPTSDRTQESPRWRWNTDRPYLRGLPDAPSSAIRRASRSETLLHPMEARGATHWAALDSHSTGRDDVRDSTVPPVWAISDDSDVMFGTLVPSMSSSSYLSIAIAEMRRFVSVREMEKEEEEVTPPRRRAQGCP
ncbi:hypothetical protein PYCCODRAFT_348599 [Trametes coccinea BRFM310]|uniref:Uncharacterized protein n=1 Tax=Trametes coccinea (strain BRFM310) TaxID=1353009 RepID=A0A1Y2J4F3_TRAC3|nr:hypothetical protein PYCCODRAFT_348599 [Trametes coccinea BRFM310]